jgi:hypothetical protein
VPDEQTKSWFKGGWAVALMLVKGLLIPLSVGLLMWIFTYPVSWYGCKAYGESIEHPWQFRFFKCYIRTNEGYWLERSEYQAHSVGFKLILEPELSR